MENLENPIKMDDLAVYNPSFPVIPPEVNGVWMVCFGVQMTPPHKVFGSLG